MLQGDPDQAADPASYEPGQLVVWHDHADAAQAFGAAVAQAGYRLRARRSLANLGVVQTVLGLPPGTSLPDARAALSAQFPDAVIDANHRYRPLAAKNALAAVAWRPAAVVCAGAATVGMVDTTVEISLPPLAGRDVEQHSVLPAGLAIAPADHGSAVALRLASLLPGADLRIAAVFRRRESADGEVIVDTTAEWLLRALNWLAGQGVAAINLSLGGPPNQLLALAVQRLDALGIGLVAAAAESGPEGPPAYPAAYPAVIAVTAVDLDMAAYPRARHGPQIDFAAPGVDLRLPGINPYLTGTSHAAPFVTAALIAAAGSEKTLAATARDLGATGRDPVFGHGLVRFTDLCGSPTRTQPQ